jgi:enterochelin esterase family protein
VLIDNGTGTVRIADLGNRRAFADWVCDRLVPWVRARYRVSRDPHRRTASARARAGSPRRSSRSNGPTCSATRVSLSGAFWRNAEAKGSPPWEWLTGQVAASPRKDVRFVHRRGREGDDRRARRHGPSILAANRRLRDALKAKGYDLVYVEAKGGTHSPGSWERAPAAGAGRAQSAAAP